MARPRPAPPSGFNLYTWSGGVTTPRYYSSAESTFIALSTVASINNNGVLGFNGTLGPPENQVNGLFYGPGGSFATITLANSSTGFMFLSPFPDINDSGVTIFHATSTDGKTGVYSGNGGPLTTYVDSSGPYANIQVAISPSLSNGGVIAFYATVDHPSISPDGIFTGPNPATDHVVRIGDELFPNFYVTELYYNGAINDHGQIAFNYTIKSLDQMTTRHGIALATPDTSAPVLTNLRDVIVGGGLTTIGGMQAVFDTVTQDGRFSADFFRPDDAAGLALRIGDAAANAVDFSLASSDYQVWNLDFSGGFSNGLSLVFRYDDSNLSVDESSLLMRHFVNGQWQIPSQTLDMVNNTITLSTTSLSPFLLTVVPEPSSALLVGFGVVALLSRRLPRRARRC